jgi:translocation and assembly module TamB
VLDMRAAVPMRLSLDGAVPAFEITQQGALTATLVADSLPLGLLASATPAIADGEGVLRARVDVTGTPRSPTVSGFANLYGGALTIVPLKQRWHDVSGALSMQGEVVRLDSLVAHTGRGGMARASGTVRLDDTRHALVDLRLYMDDFDVINRRDLAELSGDANLSLSGRLPSPVLTGSVKLDEGTIYIPETGAEAEGDILAADIGAIGADTVTAPTAGALLLANVIARDLTVTIGDGVWLQSPDARIQIKGELLVERSAGAQLPVLYGDLEALRGSYTLKIGFISREFEIASGRVQFFGTPELNPALDIVAVHKIRSPDATTQEISVQVNITGTLQSPNVQLSAGGTRQPLSESEVASLLVFGRTTSGGGAFQALQAQLQGEFLVEALAGPLVSVLEETLIRQHIVDYVRIRTRPSGVTAFATSAGYTNFLNAISVELGKEVMQDVFATVEIANILDQPRIGASLDWDISSTLSLRAGLEPTRSDPTFADLQRSLNLPKRQESLDLRWRFEYGRPPPQPAEIPKPRREPAPGEPSTPTGEPPPPPPPDNSTPR